VKKILIELPTWLGDAVMTTPAVENLVDIYPDSEITVFGSFVSTELYRAHPGVKRVVVDSSRKSLFRPLALRRLAREVGAHDLAISFRSHILSRLFIYWSGSEIGAVYSKSGEDGIHQAVRYADFVSRVTGVDMEAGELRLHWPALPLERPSIGINPGATYGSAKRWYPERFAEVASEFAGDYDIYIFGGPGEVEMASDIVKILSSLGVEERVFDLSGKTTIEELCGYIASLDLFITGDSGPMHIAAAYSIPTVALFGPTKHDETSQWRNRHSRIVRYDLDCSPCMKRECPIRTHECMKLIESSEVVEIAKTILDSGAKSL
jgi:heptosyltransferase-2